MAKRKKFIPYSFRKRYNYICTGCKKKRTTLNFERMNESVCTLCEPEKVNENQTSLFTKK